MTTSASCRHTDGPGIVEGLEVVVVVVVEVEDVVVDVEDVDVDVLEEGSELVVVVIGVVVK